ncbi:MAG: PilZ domain-containing protein [Nitrospirae bacterium]|nr:PilZ domain-containing protein [Nitrospirota bacterium]
MEERRKSKRFRIPFNVEVIPSNVAVDYVSGNVRDYSPEGFSFEILDIELGTNDIIKARFRVDPEAGYINVLGRIAWKIKIAIESQVGVEIEEIDAGTNKDLGYPFNMWKDKMRNST